MKYLFLLFTLVTLSAHSQEPVVYQLNWHQLARNGKNVIHFVSVSDRYRLSEHEDSSSVPNAYLGYRTSPAEQRIRLTGVYRKRCLKATGISETDKVYIYDYDKDRLLRFHVKGLSLIAVLNIYSSPDDNPISQYDYQIGFEIPPKYLQNFKRYHQHVLVSIGPNNPFTRGQVKPITWTKVDSTTFPAKAQLKVESSWFTNAGRGKVYQFKDGGMIYMIQDITSRNNIVARHLAVVDAKTKIVLFERIFYDSESTSQAPLNFIEAQFYMQFTGQLFKYHPPVVFGFLYHSFGCPGIDFISQSKSRLYINCDNRH